MTSKRPPLDILGYVCVALALLMVAAAVTVLATGCQSSVKIDPGTARVSHKVTTITTEPAQPPKTVRVRVIKGAPNASTLPACPASPVAGSGPITDPR